MAPGQSSYAACPDPVSCVLFRRGQGPSHPPLAGSRATAPAAAGAWARKFATVDIILSLHDLCRARTASGLARKGQRFVGDVLDLTDNRIAQSDNARPCARSGPMRILRCAPGPSRGTAGRQRGQRGRFRCVERNPAAFFRRATPDPIDQRADTWMALRLARRPERQVRSV